MLHHEDYKRGCVKFVSLMFQSDAFSTENFVKYVLENMASFTTFAVSIRFAIIPYHSEYPPLRIPPLQKWGLGKIFQIFLFVIHNFFLPGGFASRTPHILILNIYFSPYLALQIRFSNCLSLFNQYLYRFDYIIAYLHTVYGYEKYSLVLVDKI